MSVNKQVCIMRCRTGAYYTPKLILSHNFPVKVGDAYSIRVRTVFKFLQFPANHLIAVQYHSTELAHDTEKKKKKY